MAGIIPHDMGGWLPAVYAAGEFPPTYDRIRDVASANTVVFVDPAWVNKVDPITSTVSMGTGPVTYGFGMASRAMYEDIVGLAHARGLQFMMMLGIEPDPSVTNLGVLNSTPVESPLWDSWFAAYRPLVLERTAIARDLGIEWISLGYNLFSMSNQGGIARWKDLVTAMRAAGYRGKITYFGISDISGGFQEFGHGFDLAGFASLFDAIGIGIYTAVAKTSPDEALAPEQTRARIRSGIAQLFAELQQAPVPILAMVGTPSVHGGLTSMVYIEPCLACNSVAPLRARDYAQQADVYQAAAEVIDAMGTGNGKVMGLLSWGYHYRDDFTWGASRGDSAYDKSASIRGKPAEAVVRSWFKKWRAMPARAIEYRHATWDHYFVTSSVDEIAKLDGGAFAGWVRTGESFNLYPADTPGTSNVCRFFSTAFGERSSHFYTDVAAECDGLKGGGIWQFEGVVAGMAETDAALQCPAGTIPLYRLFNGGNGGAPNHRYTTSLTTRSQMQQQGWTAEGNGPQTIVACVPA